MPSRTAEPEPQEQAANETQTDMTQPIIVDLGNQRTAKIKDLKEGEGELWDEVLDVIDEVKTMLGDEAGGKTMVPVILIYRQTARRQRLERMLFPLADWDADEDDEEDDDD